MNISLTPHFEALIKNKIDSGRYNSINEVIREALGLLEERDQLHELKLAELRKEIQKGLASGESTVLDIESIKANGRLRLAAQQELDA
jgi:antitoxin ParD1/3/4